MIHYKHPNLITAQHQKDLVRHHGAKLRSASLKQEHIHRNIRQLYNRSLYSLREKSVVDLELIKK